MNDWHLAVLSEKLVRPDGGIQEIHNARERRRSRGRRDHRPGVRSHCDVAGERHHHAHHRCDHRRAGFLNYYIPLSTKVQPGLAYVDAKKQGAALGWGQFLTVVLNFLIIAGVLFLAIKAINKLKKEEPPAPAPGPTPEVKLLTEIRDLLKK
jgi:Large-conductance mechanosensitive channel, MscL